MKNSNLMKWFSGAIIIISVILIIALVRSCNSGPETAIVSDAAAETLTATFVFGATYGPESVDAGVTQQPTRTPGPTSTPTETKVPTATSVPPTATPTYTPSNTPTLTPSPVPPTATPTSTPSNTPEPTATRPIPTATQSHTPTERPVIVTATAVAARTQVPVVTATVSPPPCEWWGTEVQYTPLAGWLAEQQCSVHIID